MGDPRRFGLMAKLIDARFAHMKASRVVDVAGGRGGQQSALRQLGFNKVVSVDVRKRYAGGRVGYRYGLFTFDYAESFDLVVAMHPDDASDHAVLYAVSRGIPWIVCPCCIRPSAAAYGGGKNDYWHWVAHLRNLGGGPRRVETVTLPMEGRNVVLVGNAS